MFLQSFYNVHGYCSWKLASMESVERGGNRYYRYIETLWDSDTYCFKEQIKKEH